MKAREAEPIPPKASMSVKSSVSTLCGMPLAFSGVLVAEMFAMLLGNSAKEVL
jgi:hypothetical protein